MTEKLHEQFSLNYLQIGLTIPVLILGIGASVSLEPTMSIVIIVLWLFIVTCRNGVEINYPLKQINFFIRIAGVKLNSWEAVDQYAGYIIRRKVSSVQYTSRVQQQSFHIDQTILALFKNDPRHFKTVKIDTKENLMLIGSQFEKNFGLKRHITKKKF